MHKTLNGQYGKSPCAFCRLHECSLTSKQVKSKKCLSKECWYLVKYENHQFWKQRALQKQRKKANKQARKEAMA